jgi:NAD(P)H-dependent flavin oxidoreductase YrpB (nitropropane dioxygenase family)
VPEVTTDRYLAAEVADVFVTSEVDGMPQRVVGNELVRKLETRGPLGRLVFALGNAMELRKATGATIPELLRSGLAMRQHERLTRSQLLMAANAPMLAKKAMTDGDPVHGYLPSGSVAGMIGDRPTAADVIERIVAEAEETLARLGATH